MSLLIGASWKEAESGEDEMDGMGTAEGRRSSWRYGKGTEGIFGDSPPWNSLSTNILTESNHFWWGYTVKIP